MPSAASSVLSDSLLAELAPLRDALGRRGTVMPVVGAGLSIPLQHGAPGDRLPTWKGLLEELIAKVPEAGRAQLTALLSTGQHKRVASDLVHELGRAAVSTYIEQRFATPSFDRPSVYDALVDLPIDHFVTTNYDPFLQNAWAAKHKRAPNVVTPRDDGALTNLRLDAQPFILMLHGTASRPQTCILSAEEFDRLQFGTQGYSDALRALIMQRRLLFVGHSLSDPDLSAILRECRALAGERAELAHWFLGVDIDESQRRQLATHGVQAVQIATDGHYELLEMVLRELARTSEPVRVSTGTGSDSQPPPLVPASRRFAPRSGAKKIPDRAQFNHRDLPPPENFFGRSPTLLLWGSAATIVLLVLGWAVFGTGESKSEKGGDGERLTDSARLQLELDYIPRLRNSEARVEERADLLATVVYSDSIIPEMALDVLFTLLTAPMSKGTLDVHRASKLAERVLSRDLNALWPMASMLANRWHFELGLHKEKMQEADPDTYDAMCRDWVKARAVLGGALSRRIVIGETGTAFAERVSSPPSASPLRDWYLLFGAPTTELKSIPNFARLQDSRVASLDKLEWRGRLIKALDLVLMNDQDSAQRLRAEVVNENWKVEERGALVRDVLEVLSVYQTTEQSKIAIFALEAIR